MLGLRAALTLLFIAALFAGNFRGTARTKRGAAIRGTIEQLDPDNRVLILRCGDPVHPQAIRWQAETLFANLDGPMHPQELQPGQRVLINYQNDKGQHMAVRVELEPVYESQA